MVEIRGQWSVARGQQDFVIARSAELLLGATKQSPQYGDFIALSRPRS
jgi:hypothetical protein